MENLTTAHAPADKKKKWEEPSLELIGKDEIHSGSDPGVEGVITPSVDYRS